MVEAVDRLVLALGGVVPAINGVGAAAGNMPGINIPVTYGGDRGQHGTYQPTHLDGGDETGAGQTSAGGYGRLIAPKRVNRMTRFLVHPNEGVAVVPASMMSSAGGYGHSGHFTGEMAAAPAGGDLSAAIAAMGQTIAAAVARAQAPVQNITMSPIVNAMADTMSTTEGRYSVLEDLREQIAADVRRGMSELIPALEQQGFRRGAA